MNGFLLVDKPVGISSFGALQQLNRKFSIQRRSKKIGHGGTLDPYASGLLVIAIGKATRFLRYFLGSDKEYIASIKLGERTSTDDVEGDVIATAPYNHIDRLALDQALDQFHGTIAQIPPAFSAIHVDGQRAYALARKGQDVDIPPRDVQIHNIDVIDENLPDSPVINLDIKCSGGTYIRSIARDLGLALNSQAHLCGLRRTHACHFNIDQAHTLDFLLDQEDIEPFVRPCIDAMASFPVLNPASDKIHRLLKGLPVNFNVSKDGIYTVQFHGEMIAVIERKDHHNDFLRLFSDQDFSTFEANF